MFRLSPLLLFLQRVLKTRMCGGRADLGSSWTCLGFIQGLHWLASFCSAQTLFNIDLGFEKLNLFN